MIGYLLYFLFLALTTAGLLGVVAVYYEFGLAAMYAVVFLAFLLAVKLERRRPMYTGADSLPELFGGSQPSLPPPGGNAPPTTGAPQIGRAQYRALPGPKK
jgi:hypothetical protein